jgi:RNA polymerase sigma factor (sigma-70 family)
LPEKIRPRRRPPAGEHLGPQESICLILHPRAVSVRVAVVILQPSRLARFLSEPKAVTATEPTDHEIVQGIYNGEERAADALYDRIQPVLDRCMRRILRSTGPDYDDLMQAAFERIIVALSKKPLGSEYDLRAWSAAVATHVALGVLRRRTRERKLFMDAPALASELPGAVHVETRLEARSEVSRLQGVLGRMKPRAAETLLLHDVLGYDLNEVARLTGASVAGAQSRLVRSRKEFLRRSKGKGSQ